MNFKSAIKAAVMSAFVLFLSCDMVCAGGNETMVLIETNYGNMKLKLYNETPLHRDNFLKLIGEGYYDDLLFHRVIKEFMIQGGDPDSRNASPMKMLGGGGPDYQINAEIKPQFFHKKGALAAARQGDNVNPEKKSSGSQFYIVHGKTYTDAELKPFEDKQRYAAMRSEGMKLARQNQELAMRLRKEGKNDSLNNLMISIQETAQKTVDSTMAQYINEAHKAYTTIGGVPFLDGAYTVFGEVVEGLNVIDSIAVQKVGRADRPVSDIKMKVSIINQ